MRPSRIAIVAHASLPADPRIRRHAEALRDAGHDVDLIGLRDLGEAEEEIWNGIRIVRLPVRRTFSGFAGHLAEYLAFAGLASVRLAVEHRHRRYRVVQVATLPDFLAFAAMPVRLTGVPVLLDLHEDMPEFFRDRFASGGLRPLFPIISGTARVSAAVADAIITVHEPLRQLAIRRGVPAHRISVVMNSADERLFDPAGHPRRAWRADGALRLVHASSLLPIYGLDTAVEAMARLDSALNAHLDVYGDGPFRTDVEDAITRYGADDRVTLHGRVPLDALPDALAAADLALVPTRPEPYMAYSLSTKLLEAVAMAVPVIATDLATVRRHFDRAAIRYVPGADAPALAAAIESLGSDPAAAAAQAAAASEQARPYAWTS
ncbi:MAG TPA: glycosyltransferase, partial [Candidatus Limnocylindria bacterium]|nr:glycosyltransferase [Candidatus Limnocylindria bacterium]